MSEMARMKCNRTGATMPWDAVFDRMDAEHRYYLSRPKVWVEEYRICNRSGCDRRIA